MTIPYGVFVEYLENPLTGNWHKSKPLKVEAHTEEDACRAAALVADFVFTDRDTEVLVRITAPDNGRVIGELRRPPSN